MASAVVPGRSKCPHCQAKLTWSGAYVATLVMVLITLAICGLAILVLNRLDIEDRWIKGTAFSGLTLPPVLVMGWVGAVLQRRYSVLRKLG